MNAFDYWSISRGALATVILSLASIALGVPLGLGLALIRWAKVPLLNRFVIGYVSLIRSCPAVTLTLLIFFALQAAGVTDTISYWIGCVINSPEGTKRCVASGIDGVRLFTTLFGAGESVGVGLKKKQLKF